MKRVGMIGVLLLVGTLYVSAIGFSVSLRGVGGKSLGGDTIEVFGFPSMTIGVGAGGDYYIYQNRFVAFGTGVGALAGADIEFFKNFSLELQGGYFLGLQQNFMDIKPAPGSSAIASYTSSAIPVSATLKVRAPLGKLTLYAGAGSSNWFSTKANSVVNIDDGADKTHIETEMTFGPGVGYHGVFGMEFPLGKHLKFIGEVRGEHLTIKPQHAIITAYTVNGVDELGTLSTSDKEIAYVDDLSNFMNSPFDPNVPSAELAFNMPVNSINVFLGVAMSI